MSPSRHKSLKKFLIITSLMMSFILFQNTSLAAVAHDRGSESHTGTTGSSNQASFSWTHTPTGTARGAIVYIFTISATKTVTGVTYGGVAMTETALGVAVDSAGEPGRLIHSSLVRPYQQRHSL